MMAVQARLDWLRLTRAAKTHDQFSRRNPADVVDYSSLQVGKMIAAETTIGLLVANKSAPVGLGNPTGEAGLRRRKARIQCDHASVRRHALRQQAKQVFGYGIIHMVNDPHQHDRVEGLKLGYMSQRKMLAEKTARGRSNAALHIRYSLARYRSPRNRPRAYNPGYSRARSRYPVHALPFEASGNPQGRSASGGLRPACVASGYRQVASARNHGDGQVSLKRPRLYVNGLPAACRYFRIRDRLEGDAIAKVVFRLSHLVHGLGVLRDPLVPLFAPSGQA